MENTKKSNDNNTININGYLAGVVNAESGSKIKQTIYNTTNPENLVTIITKENIEKSKQITQDEKDKLEKKFYFIDDNYSTIFNIVCNNLDIKNYSLFTKLHNKISTLSNETYWLLGNGGEGKSTTLIRLAVESAMKDLTSFYIDFENTYIDQNSLNDMINYIKINTDTKAYIFIDNPDINIELVKIFLQNISSDELEVIIILAERKNRYNCLNIKLYY
jgi:hypothetical protein